MSPAKDLGTKYTCWKCETKFYDLRKAVPLCPKCGADQRESPALRAPTKERKSAARAAPKPKVPVVVEERAEAEEEELATDGEEAEAADEDDA